MVALYQSREQAVRRTSTAVPAPQDGGGVTALSSIDAGAICCFGTGVDGAGYEENTHFEILCSWLLSSVEREVGVRLV